MTNCKTKIDLYGKDFLKLLDFSAAEITGLVDLAAELKAMKRRAWRTAIARARTLR